MKYRIQIAGKSLVWKQKVSLKIRRKYMNRAVVVEAKRTPIGKKNGMLKDYEVQQLAAP
ncbi:acetyl-CoA C-acyltransferase, partial [Bacillus sp. B-TM1]